MRAFIPAPYLMSFLTGAAVVISAAVVSAVMPRSFSARPSADEPRSPAIAALAARVAAGDSEAVPRFWEDISRKGTPFVEDIPGDSGHCLATFLYRGGKDVRNVVIFINNGFWGEIGSNRMSRLAMTEVWHKTYRFRADARFTYLLSVNDPLTPISEATAAESWLRRSASWIFDPLNPRRFPAYPRQVSVLELPGAPAEPWIVFRHEVAKGLVESRRIRSKIIGNERTVWIYHPAQAKVPGHEPGLLVLFDGGAYKDWIPTPTILDNLMAAGRIPPVAAILVGHPSLEARNRELVFSDPFMRFLTEELLPPLRRELGASQAPRLTVIGGCSSGGLAATYAAYLHPDVFGNVLSQSGAFMLSPAGLSEQGWLIRKLATKPALPIRFHLDCGLMEDQAGGAGELSLLESNRRLRDALEAAGYQVHYREFNGGHEYVNWRGTLAEGLIELFGR